MDQLVHNCWNIYSDVCADGSIMTCSVVRAAARLFVIYITFATEWIFADDSSLQRVCWNHSKVTMMQLCVTDTSPCPVCVFIRRPKKKRKKRLLTIWDIHLVRFTSSVNAQMQPRRTGKGVTSFYN